MSTVQMFLLLLIGTQILLYAAREPIQRMLRSLGASIAGALRLLSRACVQRAQSIRGRAAGRLLWLTEQRARDQIEHELTCLDEMLPHDLDRLSQLLARLHTLNAGMDTDVRAVSAGTEPPEQVLARLRTAAMDGDLETLSAFRLRAESRQRTVRTLHTRWHGIREASEELDAIVLRILATSERVEEQAELWRRARQDDPELMRRAQHAARVAFVLPLFLFAVVLAALAINVSLLYPAVHTVFAGVSVLGVDAALPLTALLQLVLCAAGVWVAEAIGATRLFPGARHAGARKPRLAVGASVLLVVATAQAAIVLLAGTVDPSFLLDLNAPRDPLVVWLPLVGRTLIAWLLPWTLTMVALPIEHSARTSGSLFGGVGIAVFLTLAQGFRLASHGVRYAFRACAHLYDAVIALPLGIERKIRGRRRTRRARPAKELARVDTESTGERTVPTHR